MRKRLSDITNLQSQHKSPFKNQENVLPVVDDSSNKSSMEQLLKVNLIFTIFFNFRDFTVKFGFNLKFRGILNVFVIRKLGFSLQLKWTFYVLNLWYRKMPWWWNLSKRKSILYLLFCSNFSIVGLWNICYCSNFINSTLNLKKFEDKICGLKYAWTLNEISTRK